MQPNEATSGHVPEARTLWSKRTCKRLVRLYGRAFQPGEAVPCLLIRVTIATAAGTQ